MLVMNTVSVVLGVVGVVFIIGGALLDLVLPDPS